MNTMYELEAELALKRQKKERIVLIGMAIIIIVCLMVAAKSGYIKGGQAACSNTGMYLDQEFKCVEYEQTDIIELPEDIYFNDILEVKNGSD